MKFWILLLLALAVVSSIAEYFGIARGLTISLVVFTVLLGLARKKIVQDLDIIHSVDPHC